MYRFFKRDKSFVPPPTAVNSSSVELTKEFDESQDYPVASSGPSDNSDDEASPLSEKKLTTVDTSCPIEWPSFCQRFKNVFRVCASLLSFRFPIQQPPINFYSPTYHTSTGQKEPHFDDIRPKGQVRGEVLEVKVNFRDELFERYREVIEERLDGKTMKSENRLDEIPAGEFAGWNRAVFVRLRALFQIFDRGGDGLVDFNEFAGTLDEYGDETTEEERKHFFMEADVESIGSIDFDQFLKMMYDLTMERGRSVSDSHRVYFSTNPTTRANQQATTDSGHTNPASDTDGPAELNLSSLGNSLRQIDRNMSRIRSLDVVQQLQAGLF